MLRRLAAMLCLLLPLHVAVAGLVAPCAATHSSVTRGDHDDHGTAHHGEDAAPADGKAACLSTAACTVVMIANATAVAGVPLPDEFQGASRVDRWASVTRAPELPPPRR